VREQCDYELAPVAPQGRTARSHRRRHRHPVAAKNVPPARSPPTATADCTPPRSCCPRTPLPSHGPCSPPASPPRLHAPSVFSADADHLFFFICTPRRHVLPWPVSRPVLKDAEFVDEEENSTTAALLAEDDWSDVSAVVQTHLSVLMALHWLPRLLPLGVAAVTLGDGGGVPESEGKARHCHRSCMRRRPVDMAPVCRRARQFERYECAAPVAAVRGRHCQGLSGHAFWAVQSISGYMRSSYMSRAI